MVPKIHAKGSSFKGAAAYLLHDKDRADTSERVAWTEARNLAVDDPDMGWRIMAATAMDQTRLKAEAGVKNTGRKSDKHVLHISLAWHPNQEPSRDDMIAAADQAIEAIGAEDRQALFIAHDDEAHSHLHILINRVSPQDGRHLPSSNDRLKLSKWAEGYEKESGEILCENRVINNAMRAKGNYVKGERDVARHIFERMPKAANDNDFAGGAIAKERAKDHALAQLGRDQADRHAKELAAIEGKFHATKNALARQLSANIAKAKAQVLEKFRPEWKALNRDQDSERRTFDALEESFFGRASNIARTVRLSAKDIGEDRSGVITRSFRILTNAGERKAYFEAAQQRARGTLERRQSDGASEAAEPHKAAHGASVATTRASYMESRSKAVATHEADKARLQQAWKDRNTEREAAFDKLATKLEKRQAFTDDYREASKQPPDPRAEIMARYARSVEFAKAARSKAQEQDNARDQDDEHER